MSSVSPTSVQKSPTSVLSSPTSIYYQAPPSPSPAPTGKPKLVTTRETQQPKQETAAAAATTRTVYTVTTSDGTVHTFPSIYEANRFIVTLQKNEALSRAGAVPEYEYTVTIPGGISQTFPTRYEADRFIAAAQKTQSLSSIGLSSLRGGGTSSSLTSVSSRSFTVDGQSFNSEQEVVGYLQQKYPGARITPTSSSPQPYAPITSFLISYQETSPSPTRYMLDGLSFSSQEQVTSYLQSKYPYSTVTPEYGPGGYTGTSYRITSGQVGPFQHTEGTFQQPPPMGTNLLPQYGLLGKFVTGVYRAPEIFLGEGEKLVALGLQAGRSSDLATRIGGFPIFLAGETAIAAAGATSFVNPYAFKLTWEPTTIIPEIAGAGVSLVAGGAAIGVFERAVGISRLAEFGLAGRVAQAGTRALYGGAIGAGQSYVQGENPVTGAYETGALFAGTPIIAEGLRPIIGAGRAFVGERLLGYVPTEASISPGIVGKAGRPVTVYTTTKPIIPTSFSEFFAGIEGGKPVPYYRLGIVADVTMNPASVGRLQSELVGREAYIATSTLDPFYPEKGETLLKGFAGEGKAAGFRVEKDLLSTYFAPTPTGSDVVYAYGGYIGIGEGYSEQLPRMVSGGKPSILVARTNIGYFGPQPGETTESYISRINMQMSGKVGIAPENYLGASTERQVVTPTSFEGRYGTYPGTRLLTSGKLGTVYVRDVPESMQGRGPLLKMIYSDYKFVGVTRGELGKVETDALSGEKVMVGGSYARPSYGSKAISASEAASGYFDLLPSSVTTSSRSSTGRSSSVSSSAQSSSYLESILSEASSEYSSSTSVSSRTSTTPSYLSSIIESGLSSSSQISVRSDSELSSSVVRSGSTDVSSTSSTASSRQEYFDYLLSYSTTTKPRSPPVYTAFSKRQRKSKRRRAIFEDYSIKNMLSTNIAQSFGDVGFTLASEDIFPVEAAKRSGGRQKK